MSDVMTYALLSAAAFSGALISGIAGFAFSAVAGAILLHIMPPTEAVPLMMVCSIAVQVAVMVQLRQSVSWKASLMLIAGGIVGVMPAIYLLQRVDTWPFRVGFGLMVACYAAYMLFRPAVQSLHHARTRLTEALVGFGGGLIGGLTAMPGAVPTIWCDLRAMPKLEQRCLVQPFIVAMQVFALAVMLTHYGLSSKILVDAVMSLPALAVGTALGIVMYSRVKDVSFRRIVLGTLFFSGLTLVF